MKISSQWIKQHCAISLSDKEMADRLTSLGLEIGDSKLRGQDFEGVVVAEITEAVQHPNADRLRLCKVHDGNENYEVICGAPNARAGIKVAFARVGAVLPDNFKIKKSKIRDVFSYGMICSERELGLGDDHDGIIELPNDAPTGEDFRVYKNLDDMIFELELTPNRGDCFSLRGVVRELCADQEIKFTDFNFPSPQQEHQDFLEVSIKDQACPLFVGCLVKEVDCNVPTPEWMTQVLEASGTRSINLVVDITNYVMLTLGQPMHAYDAEHLHGNIEVRCADSQDKLTLLDGSEPELEQDMLLITSKKSANHSKVLGLAGIMGGQECGVTQNSKNIYFEAAHFTPQYMIGKARRLGIQTEASTRFERGVDPNMTVQAIQHACALIKSISKGKIGKIVRVEHESYVNYIEENTPTIELPLLKVQSLLGIPIGITQAKKILQNLDISVEQKNDETLQVSSPIHRFDLAIEEDYIEEILRFYGYANVNKLTSLPVPICPELPSGAEHSYDKKRLCKRHFVSLGMTEIVSYSFLNNEKQEILFPQQSSCRLLNPISLEFDVMRLSLLPGLVQSTLHNYHHQQAHSALFELGLCFVPNDENWSDLQNVEQVEKLGFVLNNRWRERHWLGSKKVDFYVIKGLFESLMNFFGIEQITYSDEELPPYVHPGQGANILFNNQTIGVLGMFHPSVLHAFGVETEMGFCEIKWEFIQQNQTRRQYKDYSIYPKVQRDLAIIVNESLSVKGLTESILSWKIKSLIGVQVFDVYQGGEIAQGMKSVGICLEFQSASETLKDEQIASSFKRVQAKLNSCFSATIRDS